MFENSTLCMVTIEGVVLQVRVYAVVIVVTLARQPPYFKLWFL